MAETLELFGTDGFRGPFTPDGRALQMTPATIENLAHGFGSYLHEQAAGSRSPVVMVGGDTRESTPLLRAATIAGLRSAGVEVWSLSVAPTPVIAWLAQRYGVAGVAITASHNPEPDNGFKPFAPGGSKFDQAALAQIEKNFWGAYYRGKTNRNGNVRTRNHLRKEYLEGVLEELGGPNQLDGQTLVVDGANGAAYNLAPRLYRALGAEVIEFACNPTHKINDNCGAAHLGGLRQFMQNNEAVQLAPSLFGGFALDGDADRIMGIDTRGREINGNHLMYLLADGQQGIVGTLYTNSGLRTALAEKGVLFHECDNGDASVTDKLHDLNLTRGGEPTGHIVDLDHLSSGDGLFIGATTLLKLARSGQTLTDLYDSLKLWPEASQSVSLAGNANGRQLVASARVQDAVAAEYATYDNKIRIIVRPSGTEPIVRVWAEEAPELGDSGLIAHTVVKRLSQAVLTAT